MSHNSGSIISGISLSGNGALIAGALVILIVLLGFWKLKGGKDSGYSRHSDGGWKGKIIFYGILAAFIGAIIARYMGYL